MSEQEFFKEKTEGNVVLQTIQRYLPFWPLFVITTAISLAISYVYLRAQIPIYVASAKVLLKDPNKGLGDSKVLDALNIFGDKKIVDNEILVLRSSTLMQKVVRELGLYATVYNQGKVREEELYKNNSPLKFVATDLENIQPSKKYYFKLNWDKRVVSIDGKSIPFNSSVMLNGTNYQLLINNNYNKTITGKNYYVVFNPVASAAGNIIANLRASAISGQSTVLDIGLDVPEQQKGKDILATLFIIYNLEGIQDKNQIAAKTLAFIDNRLGLVTNQLDSVQINLANYKSRESIVDMSAQGSTYLHNVEDLDKQKSQIDLQLEVLGNINNYVRNKGDKQGTVPSLSFINDPMLSGLLNKLYDSELQLERTKTVSGEKSDAVLLAQSEISKIKNDITENMGNIRNNLVNQKNQISSNINRNSGILSQVPEKERVFIDKTRDQSIKSSIYIYLLQKKEETAISSASTIADLKVIEEPYSYGPIRPVDRSYYLAGLVIGVLIAAFFVIVREQFNRKVLFRAEIESKTNVPLLAEIGQVMSEDPIVILEGKRTIAAEQFRSLRTNLSFMGLNDKSKVILITSSIPGEGKSFIALNLAISFTLTDKKVALMELDLRKPKLSKLMNVQRDPGISNYLVSDIPLDNIIKETSVKNLFIVSAGAIPPNPSELILKKEFKSLIDEIAKRFDYIIIDTAPVGPVSDAQLLSDYADINLFVIRHDKTPKVFLKMIDKLYEQKKFRNMGIIFNGLKSRGISFTKYGYGGYGQGYGYGYGYGNGYGYGYGGGGYYVDDKKPGFFSGIKKLFTK